MLVRIVTADDLVLEHHFISSHNADTVYNFLDQIH